MNGEGRFTPETEMITNYIKRKNVNPFLLRLMCSLTVQQDNGTA